MKDLPKLSERDAEIAETYALGGVTYRALAQKYNLTPARIPQILFRAVRAGKIDKSALRPRLAAKFG